VIDDGLADGEIRRDAGLDLQQMLNNLRIGVAAGPVDLREASANLRQKVAARANEGAISPEYVSRLETALDRLATAR
jgi:hypothetical protein